MRHLKKQIKILYDTQRDEYQLYSTMDSGKEWGFVYGTKCQRSEKQEPDEEPEYVHYSIFSELKKFIWLGYEVIYEWR